MAKVIKVDTQFITLEMNNGKQKTYPISAVAYDNPEIGDEVKLYKDGNGATYIDIPEEEAAERVAKMPAKSKEKKKEGNSGLGIAGFVIGIIAIVFSFIPIVNNLAFFIGIIAAVFGLIGSLTHIRKGLSISAIVLGVLAVVITLVLQSIWGKALDDASQQLNEVMESADSQMSNITGENTAEILQHSIDVEIGSYSLSKGDYGLITSSLPVTVTNRESENKSYSLHLEAVDGSGSRIMDDYVYANNLGAGQSQTFEAFQFISEDKYDAMQAASFNIVEVSMY